MSCRIRVNLVAIVVLNNLAIVPTCTALVVFSVVVHHQNTGSRYALTPSNKILAHVRSDQQPGWDHLQLIRHLRC